MVSATYFQIVQQNVIYLNMWGKSKCEKMLTGKSKSL